MSDRLNEIKEWFYDDEDLHQFQIEWLFEQTEKFEQIQKAYFDDNFIPSRFMDICRRVFEGK